ncbi:MAG: hypothetical protein JWO94_2996, partial [Verrucomicrobiaceae bacterium]|nr:hypothetical protein [Verrucomicrobiaceae bacterium]
MGPCPACGEILTAPAAALPLWNLASSGQPPDDQDKHAALSGESSKEPIDQTSPTPLLPVDQRDRFSVATAPTRIPRKRKDWQSLIVWTPLLAVGLGVLYWTVGGTSALTKATAS